MVGFGHEEEENGNGDGSRDESQRPRVDSKRPRELQRRRTIFEDGSTTAKSLRRMRSPWCLHPTDWRVRRWDIVMLVLLIFTATITPYEVAFSPTKLDGMFYINRLVDLLFIMDMLLNFFLGFTPRDGLFVVMELPRVARHYLCGWFGIDLVSVLPYEALGFFLNSSHVQDFKALRILRLARLTKLARVVRAGRTMRRLEAKNNFDFKKVQLAKFLVITMAGAHWMACGWKLVTVLEGAQRTWITNANLDSRGPHAEYLASLYWAAMTISTIGYGDIMAVTAAERTYAVMAMLVGASLYAYLVGNICGILASFSTEEAKFYQTMDSLNLFMDQKRLPSEMKERLRVYFRYHWHNRGIDTWQNLIELMSPALRGEVLIFCQARWVRRLPLFTACPLEFVTYLAAALTRETFTAMEMIIRKEETPERMFVIVKGLVGTSWGAILTHGQSMGEDALYSDKPRDYSCTTLTLSVAMGLHRDDLVRAVEQFPQAKSYLRRARIRITARNQVLAYAQAVNNLRDAQLYSDADDIRTIQNWKQLTSICVSTSYSLQQMYADMVEKLARFPVDKDHICLHKAAQKIQHAFWRSMERKDKKLRLFMIIRLQAFARSALVRRRLQKKLQRSFVVGLASACTDAESPRRDIAGGLFSILEDMRASHRQMMMELKLLRRDIEEASDSFQSNISGLKHHLGSLNILNHSSSSPKSNNNNNNSSSNNSTDDPSSTRRGSMLTVEEMPEKKTGGVSRSSLELNPLSIRELALSSPSSPSCEEYSRSSSSTRASSSARDADASLHHHHHHHHHPHPPSCLTPSGSSSSSSCCAPAASSLLETKSASRYRRMTSMRSMRSSSSRGGDMSSSAGQDPFTSPSALSSLSSSYPLISHLSPVSEASSSRRRKSERLDTIDRWPDGNLDMDMEMDMPSRVFTQRSHSERGRTLRDKRSSELREFKREKGHGTWGYTEEDAEYSDPLRFMRMTSSSSFSARPLLKPKPKPPPQQRQNQSELVRDKSAPFFIGPPPKPVIHHHHHHHHQQQQQPNQQTSPRKL